MTCSTERLDQSDKRFWRRYGIVAAFAFLLLALGFKYSFTSGPESEMPSSAITESLNTGEDPSPRNAGKRRNRQPEESRVYPSPLSANGRLSLNALRDAGLSASDRDAAQKIFDTALSRIEASMEGRISSVERDSDGNHDIAKFRLEADQAVYDEVSARLRDELTSQYGKSAGEILFRGFDSVQSFGKLGRLDLNIKLMMPTSSETGDDRTNTSQSKYYEVDYFDPKSGAKIGFLKCSESAFREKFGKLLDNH